MAKKVLAQIKLQVPAGKANPSPPIGPALGQHGVNIMDFCKAFNAKTANEEGMIIPVVITVYQDRSFTFITKTPPAAVLLKKAAKKADPRIEQYLDETNRMYAPYLFYKDYFAEGKPAFVPRQNVFLKDVLALAPQTSGVPVLAHPGAPFQRVTQDDLRVLKGLGLQGLEVYTSYHDESLAAFYKGLAAEFNLVPTAGSDFHGRIKPQVPFGSLNNGGYWMVEELGKRRS